jgi:ferrous iron transport protein B
LLKTVGRIEWYIKEAVPLFVLGTLVLFVGDRLGLLVRARTAVEPLVSGLLGLPGETSEAFLIGFLRRDFGAAGLYAMMREGQLDAAQVVVAAVVITLFMPCIAQLFMTIKELGWRMALAIAAFVMVFAVAVGATLNLVLHLAPGLL